MDMITTVKQETSFPIDLRCDYHTMSTETPPSITNCSNSDDGPSKKKRKVEAVLPVGFLDPLTPEERLLMTVHTSNNTIANNNNNHNDNNKDTTLAIRDDDLPLVRDDGDNGLGFERSCSRQFWKAANCFDEERSSSVVDYVTKQYAAMDHVRVHPRFLHSNATSHKWALGAFAELLDNALDEVCNGATYVEVDVLDNAKDASSKMLLFQDNGGGMTPDKLRHCMSLGYSAKSKLANTIGQYGNGFKTSTMRLGADVIVFSRCLGRDGKSPTQSIGMLSYTFLRKTGKEDIVVPMIDYEKIEEDWRMMVRSSPVDWERNRGTILQWSPYSSEHDLLDQFDFIKDHGTRIIVYNLWEDDEGLLELDFDTDPHDIQMRGGNRDEKKIEMARLYPNSRHYLTHLHSLRSYAAILYLRLPTGFKIVLRGKDVDHHNIVDDMMMTDKLTYKPTSAQNASATVTLGFVKDARSHIDVQGFNVYHKNRLIKPFWRVWNPPGSDGRGVIGVLEANFVEPAHDKQGFERTDVLQRLVNRLIEIQKKYWNDRCHQVGYSERRKRKIPASSEAAESVLSPSKDSACAKTASEMNNIADCRLSTNSVQERVPAEDSNNDEMCHVNPRTSAKSQKKTHPKYKLANCIKVVSSLEKPCTSEDVNVDLDSKMDIVAKLMEENCELKQRLGKDEAMMVNDLLKDLRDERDKSLLLNKEVLRTQQKVKELENEHTVLLNALEDEREQHESLKQSLKEANHEIEELKKKVTLLESRPVVICKSEC